MPWTAQEWPSSTGANWALRKKQKKKRTPPKKNSDTLILSTWIGFLKTQADNQQYSAKFCKVILFLTVTDKCQSVSGRLLSLTCFSAMTVDVQPSVAIDNNTTGQDNTFHLNVLFWCLFTLLSCHLSSLCYLCAERHKGERSVDLKKKSK